MAIPFVGFESMNNWMSMEYERNGRSLQKALWKGTFRVTAKVYTHYSSRMVPAVGVLEPWKVLLFKPVGMKLTQVWESAEYTSPAAVVDIDTLPIPDGIYYLSSTAESTLTEQVMIRNNKELIPEPEYIVIFPAYMFNEWGVPMSPTRPPLTQPAIIKWQGIRPIRISSVPLGESNPLPARLTRDKLWHQAVTLATQQKQFVRVPVTTPWGGIMVHPGPMRYGVENWDDLNPKHTVDSMQVEFSPSEDADGFPSDSGIGVISSGYQHPETLHWIYLSPQGHIGEITRNRERITRYGPHRKHGLPHPRRWDVAPTLGERQVFMDKHYNYTGAGPDIWRAWSICPDIDNPNVIFVANTGTHSIAEISLQTGFGKTICGEPNVRGNDEGTRPHFDQPRGVLMLSKGPHAGKLFICDEHNSACGVYNLTTGEYKILFKAARVPQNPAVELGLNMPMDIKNAAGAVTKTGLRTIWGMPGLKGSVQKLDSPDLQFIHPCQAAEMSDGRIVMAHHDEYRLSIIDLVAGTMTYFHDIPLLGSRSDALPRAWPSVFCDKLGAFGTKDDIFVACWFQSSEQWLNKDGVRYNLTAGGFLTCEGSGELCRQFAYARALIPGVNGELLYSGDDANGTHIIRAKLPNDPKLDQARYERGNEIYSYEGKKVDGSIRAAFRLNHGPGMTNYWNGIKCGPEFAAMDQTTFDAYWKNRGATDITAEQFKDFRYWAMWQSAEGVQRLREGLTL